VSCSSCGYENPSSLEFCGNCGNALARSCPSCGFENPAEFKFCGKCGAVLAEAATQVPEPEPRTPSSFASGRYKVKRLLGEGAKKRVYLARDERLDRDVALALIKTEGLDETGRIRVRREAQAMGRLGDHPRIVTVYDTGEKDGQPYIVSEYMGGGDLEARDVIRAHNAIVREQTSAHGGYEVELQGDGFLLAFSSERSALLCAIAIQRAFASHSEAHPEEPIRVRIGLHRGEVLRDADRFFGRTVILAARIAGQAEGGEILVSSHLKELTESTGDLSFGAAREVKLKGISQTQRVHAVEWE
jgi:hypothetical protein